MSKYEIDYGKGWKIKVTNPELFHYVGLILQDLGFELHTPLYNDEWASVNWEYIGVNNNAVCGLGNLDWLKEFTVNDLFDDTLMNYVKKEVDTTIQFSDGKKVTLSSEDYNRLRG